MSRSRKVSRRRRTLPASETWSAAGWARRASTAATTAGSPLPSSGRVAGLRLRALLQRLQHVLLDLRAEPAERPQPLVLGRVAQTLERGHVELEPDPPRGLRAETGKAHERDHVGRDPRFPLGQRLDLARLDDLDDLLLDRLPDALQLLRLAVQRELRDRAAGLADPLRGAAVGKHTKRLRALQLEHVGEQLELLDHLCVPGKRHCRDHRDRCTMEPRSASPRTTSARTSSRWSPRCSSVSAPTTDSGRRRRLARRHRRAGRRAGGTRERRVSVLHRATKEGLGPAYIAGFKRALADGADLVLEMDCDFSHDPDDVPRLIAAAADADVVLGSRYVEGGGVENWGAGRSFVSRAGSWYAQVLLADTRPRPDRRVQVLPPRSAGADRPRRGLRRRVTRSRSRRPTARCARASVSSRSRSRSPTGRRATRR